MFKSEKNKRIIYIITMFVLLCMIAFLLIQLYITKTAEGYILEAKDAPSCDAVMILGAFVMEDGTPSLVLQDRLEYGLRLYNQKKAKKVLVSGDHGTRGYDEVNAMKTYLMQKGVPREDIFLDHAGFDTYDSMYRAKAVFGVESLLISTQNFHMGRALYIARKLGIEAYGYPSRDKKIYNMSYLYFRESLARVKAFLEVELWRRKPKYLGEKIPIGGSGLKTEG